MKYQGQAPSATDCLIGWNCNVGVARDRIFSGPYTAKKHNNTTPTPPKKKNLLVNKDLKDMNKWGYKIVSFAASILSTSCPNHSKVK